MRVTGGESKGRRLKAPRNIRPTQGVVKEAMNSGKRAIAAGPGNPPAVVDETAHLDVAAKGIVLGGSIDNNIICTAEKEVLAVSSICDRLKELLVREGCYLMNDKQVRQLEGVVLEGDHTNKKFVVQA